MIIQKRSLRRWILGTALFFAVARTGSASDTDWHIEWEEVVVDSVSVLTNGLLKEATVELRPLSVTTVDGKSKRAVFILVFIPEIGKGMWFFRESQDYDLMNAWRLTKENTRFVLASERILAVRYVPLGGRLIIEHNVENIPTLELLRQSIATEADKRRDVIARGLFWKATEILLAPHLSSEFLAIRGEDLRGVGTLMRQLWADPKGLEVRLENVHGAVANIDFARDFSISGVDYERAPRLGMACDSIEDCFEKTPFIVTDTGIVAQDKKRQLSRDESTQLKMLNQVYRQIKSSGVEILKEKVYCFEAESGTVRVFFGAPPELKLVDDVSLKIIVNPINWDDVFVTYRGKRRLELVDTEG